MIQAFYNEDWEIVRGPEPRAHGAVFVDAFNRRLNTSIVATRGTNPRNMFDVFQDMVLFNGERNINIKEEKMSPPHPPTHPQ